MKKGVTRNLKTAFQTDSKLKQQIRLNRAARTAWVIFRFFLLIGISFILLYPVIYMLSMSFRVPADVTDPSVVWIPKHFVLQNFKDVIKVMKYPEGLMNTAVVSVVSAVLQVISCSLTGYGFARFQFKERNVLFVIVIMTLIIPPQILSIPLYAQFKEFDIFGILGLLSNLTGLELRINLLNKFWVFYLPSLFGQGIRAGLYILVFRQFFKGMPAELEEAALIDGCGSFKTYLKIMVPLTRGAMLTVFLFSMVWHWNDYFYSFMFVSSKRMLSTTLATLRNSLVQIGVDAFDPFMATTYVQAGCLLTILPLLIIYIFTQRYFTESIERTGIVG